MRLFSVVFLCFAFFFFADTLNWVVKYESGKEKYKELSEEVIEETDKDMLTIDWNKLKKENPDIVGWIVMAPEVNYPIVQSDDNTFYLQIGFHREYNINGCIFMSAYNSNTFSDKNTILYGHNMRNGQMFGNNDLYASKKYAKKHPYFYIYTEKGRMTYKIFDTMTVQDASEPYAYIFDPDEFSAYLKNMKNLASYTIAEAWPEDTDHIITLSTCTAHGTLRFLIQAKLYDFRSY